MAAAAAWDASDFRPDFAEVFGFLGDLLGQAGGGRTMRDLLGQAG